MSSTDWDEVKRLAADFHKAQLSVNLQRFTERNCVEIVTKLKERKIIEILHSYDGKEYVTPEYLVKQIKDEVYDSGGRIDCFTAAECLNIDLVDIVNVSNNIEKYNLGLKGIEMQFINKDYEDKIAENINEKLEECGYIDLENFETVYHLRVGTMQQIIEKELGRKVFAKQDPNLRKIFYTDNFLTSNKLRVRGALYAITKPTALYEVARLCAVPPILSNLAIDSLQILKQIPGKVIGKQTGWAVYVPSVYSNSQIEWIDNSFKRNGYLECDTLVNIGIPLVDDFMRSHFKSDEIIRLPSCIVRPVILEFASSNVEEAIASASLIDLRPLLPSVLTDQDIKVLLDKLQSRQNVPCFKIFAQTVAITDAYLRHLNDSLEVMAENMAKQVVKSGKWLESVIDSKVKSKVQDKTVNNKMGKKEERRKKALTGKAGGGSQGRETKTKSTKRKYMQSRNEEIDSDEESAKPASNGSVLQIVSLEDITKELEKNEKIAAVSDLAETLASYFVPHLNKHALSIANKLAQTEMTKTVDRSEVGERLNIIIDNIEMFFDGVKHLDKDDQPALIKYLLRSLGADALVMLFKLAAQQALCRYSDKLTINSIEKELAQLPQSLRTPLTCMYTAITILSIKDFLIYMKEAMDACCLVRKKCNKKKVKSLVKEHEQALVQAMSGTDDPALALHLVCNIIFTRVTGSALHMSGKHVASVLTYLRLHIPTDVSSLLCRYHALVIQLLTSDENSKRALQDDLQSTMSEVKIIGSQFSSSNKLVEEG